jgi:hypothetical protein
MEKLFLIPPKKLKVGRLDDLQKIVFQDLITTLKMCPSKTIPPKVEKVQEDLWAVEGGIYVLASLEADLEYTPIRATPSISQLIYSQGGKEFDLPERELIRRFVFCDNPPCLDRINQPGVRGLQTPFREVLELREADPSRPNKRYFYDNTDRVIQELKREYGLRSVDGEIF